MSGVVSSINSMTMLVGRQGFMRAQKAMNQAMERLATGKRINRASDDPSGLIAAEKLGARRVTLDELIKASERISHRLDATEGALSVISDLAVELQGLVVTSANRGGTSTGEREALQVEANGVVQAINHIVETSSFAGEKLLTEGWGGELNGRWLGYGGMSIENLGRISVEREDPETGDIVSVSYALEDILSGRLSLVDGDSEAAQMVVDKVVETIADTRAHIGIQLKYTYGSQTDVLRIEKENTAAAESAIMDADFAQEVSNLVRGQVLREASMATMQLAQQQAWNALSLLG